MGVKKKKVRQDESAFPISPGAASKVRDLEREASKNEIDAIFGKKKRKVALEEQRTLDEEGTGARPLSHAEQKGKKTSSPGEIRKKKMKTGDASKRERVGKTTPSPPSKPKRKTKDGLTIYGEDELKWNSKNAGGTPLCPFDCQCCF